MMSSSSTLSSKWSTGPEKAIPLIRKKAPPTDKRIFDFVVAMMLIVICSPLLLAITVYIKLVSPGSPVFIQPRPGHGGKKFRMFKFRTMHTKKQGRDQSHRQYVADLARSNAELKKPKLDAEFIPGGSLLRRLSLDELPQLFNIIRGEMSLVGPRPDLLELEDYLPWQLKRFEVLPGLTGLWQTSDKNNLTFNEMIELDLEYVNTRSLWLDVQIVFKTALQQLKLKNS